METAKAELTTPRKMTITKICSAVVLLISSEVNLTLLRNAFRIFCVLIKIIPTLTTYRELIRTGLKRQWKAAVGLLKNMIGGMTKMRAMSTKWIVDIRKSEMVTRGVVLFVMNTDNTIKVKMTPVQHNARTMMNSCEL